MSQVRYLEYFELSQEPFSNAPVSRLYYSSSQHQEALMRLMHAVDTMKGLAVLTGPIGAGKTTLARRLLDNLTSDKYEAALMVIVHSGITASWLLRRIAIQLGVKNPQADKLALLSQVYKRLIEIYEAGRKAVLLIDEMQMLQSRELMEEFRGLLNLEVPERKLITFVFFGLPELERNLYLDPPLAQRVALRHSLSNFDLAASDAYVKHRLRLAGAKRMLFTGDAIELVYKVSDGVPRLINTVCDNALFEAFVLHRDSVDTDLVRQVAANLHLHLGPAAPQDTEPQKDAGQIGVAAGGGPRQVAPADIDALLDDLQ